MSSVEFTQVEEALFVPTEADIPIIAEPVAEPVSETGLFFEEAAVEVCAVEESLGFDTEGVVENSTVDEAMLELAAEVTVADAALIVEEQSVVDSFDADLVDAASEVIASAEVISEAVVEVAAEPVIEAPLTVFEVTEHAPIETTLEKIMEPVIEEPIIQSVIVEEAQITAHPLEAPHQQAPSDEMVEETATDQTTPTDENDENTTETE
ncbi:MAG: hypothetical protein LBQ98_10345 [Nitrososphaerota archaeon]|jgi:hypothetical protein|nr:hypothetical protein [Nitrososphaerota archaeon]